MAEGIEIRVGRDGSKSYRASVWSNRDRKRIRKTFGSLAEARNWRADALVKLDQGALRAPKPTTVREAWEAFYAGAKEGTIRNRAGDPYKPSVVRAYEKSMRLRVRDELGDVRLSDVRRIDLQDLVDRLLADGLAPSTVNTTLHPLRAIFRRALARGELAVNPCAGLELPTDRARRERFASPIEADALIEAAPEGDRATWATAFHAGLRQGELRALRVADVDLATGVIRVERGWDRVEGAIELKSHSGRRRVPVVGALRDHLLDHLARTGREGDDLIFGRTTADPFAANRLQRHADLAWKAAKLTRITPHECRHSYAATMIAAGVNPKALQTFMGHASITVTLDTYGHLFPGSEAEAAALVETYLAALHERAAEQARAASRDNDGTMSTLSGDPRRPEATT